MKTRFGATIAKTLLLAGLIGATPALAHSATLDSGAPSKVVSFKDLDLTTRKGVDTLYSRLKAAANEVCVEMYQSTGGPSAGLARLKCYHTLLEDAVQRVGNRRLTALHEHREPAAGFAENIDRAVTPAAAGRK